MLSFVKLGCGNNLIGYYMYHGGTNRLGRLSTLQESKATGYPNDVPILNYDFHTCLSQYGQAREQYELLNLLHLFSADFGAELARMEHVPAEEFVPCTDLEHLRCCLRTDGKSGYVFINHYQRRAKLKDIHGAQIRALDVDFPALDITGDQAFFFPVHMGLGDIDLSYATAQPMCRSGNTYFFLKPEGITSEYCLRLPGGKERLIRAEAGLNSGFEVCGIRIVTLEMKQARYLRRLEPAVLTAEPVDEPFEPPYEEELNIGCERERRWSALSVSSAEGFVSIDEVYDVAQIYADKKLAADNYYSGEAWKVPAALLYGKSCYLVMSEFMHDCYIET